MKRNDTWGGSCECKDVCSTLNTRTLEAGNIHFLLMWKVPTVFDISSYFLALSHHLCFCNALLLNIRSL
jgi:hypothetical protein